MDEFVWTIDLPVSTGRPYVTDQWRRYVVVARTAVEASLIACQMALGSAMPMSKGTIVACEF